MERAADALLLVAKRFMAVGQSGTEYGLAEYGLADWPPDEEDLGPSISYVTIDDEAAYVCAITQFLSHEMAETMKFIIVQELTAAGVEAVVSADYNPIRGISAQEWPRAAR